MQRYDRKPLSQFGPGFGVLVAATVIMMIAFPPVGLLFAGITFIAWTRRKAVVNRRKAAIYQRARERAERERILAFKSL